MQDEIWGFWLEYMTCTRSPVSVPSQEAFMQTPAEPLPVYDFPFTSYEYTTSP